MAVRRDSEKVQTDTWSDEKKHALWMLELGARQIASIVVQTNDDGSTYYTKNKARVFSAKGKKDFAYAMLFAFIRFLQWVNQYGDEESDSVPEEDAEMCG